MGLFCGGLAESDEGLESNGSHFFWVGAEAEEGQSVMVAERVNFYVFGRYGLGYEWGKWPLD